jgi:isoleucyl-tRNA synthetase
VHNFCVVDLGGCFLDVTKDRLYTMPVASPARRSAQTAMFHIAEAMVRWLAPILSFTAEEVWDYLPGPRAASVFHATWHPLPAVGAPGIDWAALIALRADVQRELERLREAGQIGAPLQARVELLCTPETLPTYAALGDELRFLLITSDARVSALPPRSAEPAGAVAAASRPGVWIRALPSEAPKCVRCWQLRADVGQDAAHPELCLRCVSNVDGAGETRDYA